MSATLFRLPHVFWTSFMRMSFSGNVVRDLPPAFSTYEYSWDSPVPLRELCIWFSPLAVLSEYGTPPVWKEGDSVTQMIYHKAQNQSCRPCTTLLFPNRRSIYLRSLTLATLFSKMAFALLSFLISSFRTLISSSLCWYWISPLFNVDCWIFIFSYRRANSSFLLTNCVPRISLSLITCKATFQI